MLVADGGLDVAGRETWHTLVRLFRGHADWRLPTMIDLQGVVDTSVPGSGVDAPCIDPAFGATGDNY